MRTTPTPCSGRLCCALHSEPWCGGAGIVDLVCCSAPSHFRIGYLISSCTAETCRSCLEMPATSDCLVSGSGGCPLWQFRWRRHCSCLAFFFIGVPQSRWDPDPAAGSHQLL